MSKLSIYSEVIVTHREAVKFELKPWVSQQNREI